MEVVSGDACTWVTMQRRDGSGNRETHGYPGRKGWWPGTGDGRDKEVTDVRYLWRQS